MKKNSINTSYLLSLLLIFFLSSSFDGCTLLEEDFESRDPEMHKLNDQAPKRYELILSAKTYGSSEAWDNCVASGVCKIQATVTFKGKRQIFNLGETPSWNHTYLESDNPNESVKIWVGAEILVGFQTIFEKTVPVNYCFGPQLEYDLVFHYVPGVFPKMYYKVNDITCQSEDSGE